MGSGIKFRDGVKRIPVLFNYNPDQVLGYATLDDSGNLLIEISNQEFIDVFTRDHLRAYSIGFSEAFVIDYSVVKTGDHMHKVEVIQR